MSNFALGRGGDQTCKRMFEMPGPSSWRPLVRPDWSGSLDGSSGNLVKLRPGSCGSVMIMKCNFVGRINRFATWHVEITLFVYERVKHVC